MRRARIPLLLPLGILLVGLTACGSLLGESLGPPGEVVTVAGEVIEVDSSEMAVDGPGRIELRTEDHGRVTVVLPSCMGPCAREATDRFFNMEVGERWQVTGEVTEGGTLSVDDDGEHELRLQGER